ncbi:unnamed protein product [Mortierella alpina]
MLHHYSHSDSSICRPLSVPSSPSSGDKSSRHSVNALQQQQQHPSSPLPHPFLKSPTHARSNSGTYFPHSLASANNGPLSPSALKDTSAMSEDDSPTMLSFASGYSLHQHLNNSGTTLVKPVALYPQEHPQRKRLSPRFSASSTGSYANYSSALASTYHQQQQQQLQQQSRRSLRQDSPDRYGSHAYYTNNSTPSSPNHRHHNRNSFNSPPSPCAALDASTCHCSTGPHSSQSYPTSVSSSAFPSPSLTALSTTSSSASLSSTSMAHCSPVFTQQQTSFSSPETGSGSDSLPMSPTSPVDMLPPSSGSSASSTRTSSTAPSPSPSSWPVRTQKRPSLASSASALMMIMASDDAIPSLLPSVSSASSPSPSPSPPLQPAALQNPESPKRRRRKEQAQQLQQQQMSRQQQMQQLQYARRALGAQEQGQGFHPQKHHYHHHQHQQQQQQQKQQQQQQKMHSDTTAWTSAQSSSSLLLQSSTLHPYVSPSSTTVPSSSLLHSNNSNSSSSHRRHPHTLHLRNYPNNSNHLNGQCSRTNGNAPQTIAQISSRYIWLLWLPLLPLLILAAAGQTSASFESPVKYLV